MTIETGLQAAEAMKDDGGPAFPIERGPVDFTGDYAPHYGMTLRDWFAGQALAGEMARGIHGSTQEQSAEWCYAIADAMLAARQR